MLALCPQSEQHSSSGITICCSHDQGPVIATTSLLEPIHCDTVALFLLLLFAATIATSTATAAAAAGSTTQTSPKACLSLGTPCTYREGYGTELCCQPPAPNDVICGCNNAPLGSCKLRENVCCVSGSKCGCKADGDCFGESVCIKSSQCCS